MNTESPVEFQYQQIRLSFSSTADGEFKIFDITLDDDDAGELRTVLPAITGFLRAAGFTYVVSTAVQKENGEVIFDDQV